MRVALVAASILVIPSLALAGGPQRKAGWWELTNTITTPMAMTQKVHFCTDRETEAKHSPVTQRGPNLGATAQCSPNGAPVRTPAGWSFSTTCRTSGGTVAATSGVASGDFASAYRVEAVTRVGAAPLPQMYETRMSVSARWLGACPAGRVPGEMVMENGTVVNLNQARGGSALASR